MPVPLALPFDPFTRFTLPALLSCRSRRQRPLRRDWLRIADRLAAGFPPAAAALPEGGDEAMVAGLLQREDFQALVEAARVARGFGGNRPPQACRHGPAGAGAGDGLGG